MDIQTLNIGEIGKLFNLSVQTLRYYDEIGLFVPEYRAANNYRKYRFEQIYQLAGICHMRQLGYPLQLIATTMAGRGVQTSLAEMENRCEKIHKEKIHLEVMEDALKRKIAFVKQQMALAENMDTTVQQFGLRHYLPIGSEKMLYKDESFYLNPTLVIYHNQKRTFGAYIETIPTSEKGEGLLVRTLPAGPYLCSYHCGNYETIWKYVMVLRKEYATLGLQEWSVHFNIIDQFVEKDPTRFITQVQIPLVC